MFLIGNMKDGGEDEIRLPKEITRLLTPERRGFASHCFPQYSAKAWFWKMLVLMGSGSGCGDGFLWHFGLLVFCDGVLGGEVPFGSELTHCAWFLLTWKLDIWVELLVGVSLFVLCFLCSGLAMLSAGMALMDHSLVLGYKRPERYCIYIFVTMALWSCVREHLMAMPLHCVSIRF
ncbi:hypothetical protein V8G54_011679 [Vigna mungo]|uniref:Uncharacterized protein n=1 Tax=Vigna mungo TaxID=3915 RepID=A0AAQ3NRN6_VIGMU